MVLLSVELLVFYFVLFQLLLKSSHLFFPYIRQLLSFLTLPHFYNQIMIPILLQYPEAMLVLYYLDWYSIQILCQLEHLYLFHIEVSYRKVFNIINNSYNKFQKELGTRIILLLIILYTIYNLLNLLDNMK